VLVKVVRSVVRLEELEMQVGFAAGGERAIKGILYTWPAVDDDND
jgi:hypothetical protein